MNKSSFDTWFTPIVPLRIVNNTLTLQVPSPFFYEYLEGNYIELIRSALHQVIGKDAKLEYSVIVDNGSPRKPKPAANNSPRPARTAAAKQASYNVPSIGHGNGATVNVQPGVLPPNVKPDSPFVIPVIKPPTINSQLNPTKTLDNFVSGKCNQLGISAAEAIAINPTCNQYNPVLIFGNSGLGKTHLAQAIGNAIKERHPEKVVVFVEAHMFETQYIDAVRNNTRNDFIHFYQMLDALIIDDVQEFSGKEGTQNTFFAIFNALHQAGKQIILTCDTKPVELKGLSERLLTRFKWGLNVEMTMPDYETRLNILRRKCYNSGVVISMDILKYIAQNITSNVRDLESSLISLILQSTVMRDEITLDLAKDILSKTVKINNNHVFQIGEIRKSVCSYFKINEIAITSKSRAREIAVARQLVMYFAKQLTELTFKQIGIEMGGRDHSTVLHACKAVNEQMAKDENFRRIVSEVENKIKTEAR